MEPPYSVFLNCLKLKRKMNKKALRKQYREMRNVLSPAAKHAMLAGMQDFFREIPLIPKALVLSYKAIASKNEVDPSVFEEVLSTEYDAVSFCFPSVYFEEGEMDAYLEDEQVTWEEVKFGLSQPASGNIVSPEKIDSVLVPLLAFDYQGNRLGYGKGFYDRFLSTCRTDCKFIGLTLFDEFVEIDNLSKYDIPLHKCITPKRILSFEK